MDIDLDFSADFKPEKIFPNIIQASQIKNNQLVKHPCGYYIQSVPVDKVTNLSAIPYKQASDFDLYKIDFLHVNDILSYFNSKKEIRLLVKKQPDWNLLENKQVVSNLFQLHRHYDLVNSIKPKSVNDLADCIALIRPGKKHLISRYLSLDSKVKQSAIDQLYTKTNLSYYKKPHAISYALMIVIQLHLIKYEIIDITK